MLTQLYQSIMAAVKKKEKKSAKMVNTGKPNNTEGIFRGTSSSLQYYVLMYSNGPVIFLFAQRRFTCVEEEVTAEVTEDVCFGGHAVQSCDI